MTGRLGLAVIVYLGLLYSTGSAQPEDFKGAVATDKWTILHKPGRRTRNPVPLAKNSPLIGYDSFEITGPMPGHPFVLGQFSTDGKWGVADGCVQMITGNDGALQLAWADQFELEGIAEHAAYGGWFFLVGWDQERGTGIINCNMKESGSPWFMSEFRGKKAITDGTTEFESFDWLREQPFRLKVQNNELSLEVGRFTVFDREPLSNYQPGRIIFGVYETRYGTKPIRFKSLRIRALKNEAEEVQAEPPVSE